MVLFIFILFDFVSNVHSKSLHFSCLMFSFGSALAAFYTRNFADKIPDIKPPLLQVESCADDFDCS